MAKSVSVVVNQEDDERVIQQLAACLRANDRYTTQLRDFADALEDGPKVAGLQFQPKPGQILVCHFGLGFQRPEMVKTRPVMVISPKVNPWTRLCVVIPISSKAPNPVEGHHYRLPDGIVPGGRYEESWLKGDTLMAVGSHRLDRLKIGFRQYVAPCAPTEVLKEARRCILHATGMHSLTVHW
ncbi:MAG: type II toxin-antitoxin system PemK/MazF family toxin [Roseobacter sp.]|uniref:type II toxin-antitoxin system PemK/MazF family toxin n=1 Tax=Roseibium sp. TaxID=1936156 RepID=UPI0032662C8C